MVEEPYEGLAATLDTAAELYEQVRPVYPVELFDDLAALLGPHATAARVLEIGAGTGQAMRGLLAHGWSVVALESGRELARVGVLSGLGDAELVVAPFEHWQAAEEGWSRNLRLPARLRLR